MNSNGTRSKTIVLKFGGSSLATVESREIAASRVLEARARGHAPVVVCSALGRSPEPYATDTLAALLGPVRGGPNRDLLLACGELIACAVFAELLTAWGAPAQAMSGAQAGVITDGNFSDARVIGVNPQNLMAAIDAGIIPVVAGFQGVTENGAITTLGRGGSDLTAVVLGDALRAEMVEIYTDVSGVMTGDPRRIAGAHTIEKVQYEEMVELAGEGAKVMHSKAAEWARLSITPYVVKGLRSNVGTKIDDTAGTDRQRPVTGITALRNISFARIIVGDADDEVVRREHEVTLFRRLAERNISIDMINVNNAGIFFVFDTPELDSVRHELADLNLALRIRPHCAKLSIVGSGMRGTPGVMYRVVRALTEGDVSIIHSTDSNITISVLVADEDSARAEQQLHDAFRLGPAKQQEAIA
jgi:aspartate kinase